MDPNNDYTTISSDDLNIIATFSRDHFSSSSFYSLAVFDEQHILITSSDDLYLVNIDDTDDITCIGDLRYYQTKGFVCADMSQKYLDFANCPDTTEMILQCNF